MFDGTVLGTTMTDLSSGSAAIPGVSSIPVGNTYRGLFGDWFNKNNIEREDWQRNEQSLNNAAARSAYLFGMEADFQREMFDKSLQASQSQYKRAVQGMKEAGINPVFAFSNGAQGAGVPSVGSASASGTSGGYRSRQSSADTRGFLNLIASIVSATAGLISTSYKSANALEIADKRLDTARFNYLSRRK